MNPRIQYLINHPFEVGLPDVALLQGEIDKYPYFSTLRTLLLFGLKEFDHSSYQEELKKTSIHCPSRVALYHYLQREKQESSGEMPVQEIIQAETVSERSLEIPVEKESPVNPEVAETDFVHAERSIETMEETRPEKVEKPDMSHSEFTFSEWLSLAKTRPDQKEKAPSEKDIKFQLIDQFIEKAPKISPVSKTTETNPVPEKTETPIEYSDLMTETLAQIYTEQKKYDKAIRAYKILSLKYPEKSEFFSDKISEIENLKNS